MNYKEIGFRIQFTREMLGLSQKELAQKLGVSQSTLSNYEKGKRRIYLAQLNEIAEALDKPADYFLQPLDTIEQKPLSGNQETTDEMGELLRIVGDLGKLSREGRISVINYIGWLKFKEEEDDPHDRV